MDEQRRSDEYPVPDIAMPEADNPQVRQDHSQLVPDIHQDSYTVQEVASLLGMSADMIRHAVQAGDLRAEHAGHEIVCIRRDDLLAWLNSRGAGI